MFASTVKKNPFSKINSIDSFYRNKVKQALVKYFYTYKNARSFLQ